MLDRGPKNCHAVGPVPSYPVPSYPVMLSPCHPVPFHLHRPYLIICSPCVCLIAVVERSTVIETMVTRSTPKFDNGILVEVDLINERVDITNKTDDQLDISKWRLSSEVGDQVSADTIVIGCVASWPPIPCRPVPCPLSPVTLSACPLSPVRCPHMPPIDPHPVYPAFSLPTPGLRVPRRHHLGSWGCHHRVVRP